MSENESKVNYQEGNHSVQHRNIDAAGDDHPFGDSPAAFEGDMRALIRRVADDLYESWQATIREYLANAETACLRAQEYSDTGNTNLTDGEMIIGDSYQPKIEVTWNKKEDRVTIQDNGVGMSANTVDQVFRQVGRTTGQDDGKYSGQYGQGVLSFVKVVGLDNAVLMTTHSRINDDNASYYISLSGVEPIRGSLPEDQYGTKFQMTPQDDFPIRDAIEQYAEWMRVPVRYEEIGENGAVSFQEDYGDKKLYESYTEDRICLMAKQEGAFEAYSSPDAEARTLLLSMDIDRNDGKYEPSKHGAPFPFDIRLLDESGKVIESSNGNEGLMPTPRSQYRSMLKEARSDYITEELLSNNDVVGQYVKSGPNAGSMVVKDEILDSAQPLPATHQYIGTSDLTDSDEPGETVVLIGPHDGRSVVSEERWSLLDEGRAEMYVPEDELESYDVETGEGDLCLPQPTSDRDRLQEHTTFWKYVGGQFGEQFDEKVHEIYSRIEESDDSLDTIMSLDPEDLVITTEGME